PSENLPKYYHQISNAIALHEMDRLSCKKKQIIRKVATVR
ncbi:hypothetical protein A343_1508, partial [Porphyromonas gingivalis JCVI SC001]